MITPDDIRQARFAVAARGYSMPDVDDFLDALIRKASQSSPQTATAGAQQRIRELQAQVARLQRENAELRQHMATQQPANKPRGDAPPSVLEKAYDRMSQMTESGKPAVDDHADERPLDYDWHSSAIFSSLESSLFGDDRR